MKIRVPSIVQGYGKTRFLAVLMLLFVAFNCFYTSLESSQNVPFSSGIAFANDPEVPENPASGNDIWDVTITGNGSNASLSRPGVDKNTTDFNGVLGQAKYIAMGFSGLLTIIMFVLMLLQFAKLGAAGDNEMQRKRAIGGILTTGGAMMLFGGATFVIGFFWNVLANSQAL